MGVVYSATKTEKAVVRQLGIAYVYLSMWVWRMGMNLREQSLADLALNINGAATLFRQHQLDYCCGGKQTLAEAAAGQQVDVAVLEQALASMGSVQLEQDWRNASLPDLIHFILQRYHDVHRVQFPELIALAQKVERVHAGKEQVPTGLAAQLQALDEELESHMRKEEQILFPMIRQGSGQQAAMPIRVMEKEHDDAGEMVANILRLTGNLLVPEHACTTWKVLYQGVDEMLADLMNHIHLENSVLFPRALAGEC